MEAFVALIVLVGVGLFLLLPLMAVIQLSKLRGDHDSGLQDVKRELRGLRNIVEALQRTGVTPPAPQAKPERKPPAVEPTAPLDVVFEAEEIQAERETAPVRPVSPAPVPPVRSIPHRREPVAGSPPEPRAEPRRQPVSEPAPPRVPSKFETAARETLQKIWNWIIIGEEYVPAGTSMEFAVASQWLLRIGILILVVGVGFFLKYSVENDLINELGRVMLSAAAGLGMLVTGTRLLGKKYHLLGQGLLGGGLATLYFAVFAAANFYEMIEQLPAFVLMTLITALAGGIAVRFNSILVAVLGVLGGYGTPIMLSTGVVNFPGLFGYMLILGVGVLAICYWRNWPLVNYLAFFCNYALFFASMQAYQVADFWEVMPFAIAFFVLFSTMTFLYKVANGAKSNLLDLLALLINAGVFYFVSYHLVTQAYTREWAGVVTLSLAGFYTLHVVAFLQRKLVDRELLVCFSGLAAFFLAVTMPLILSPAWVTVSWSLQALVLLWIAGKLGSEFIRHLAYVLYAIVLIRFGVVDLPGNFLRGPSTADMPMADYVRQLVERIVMFGVPIASIGGAYWLLKRQQTQAGNIVGPENDISGLIRGMWAMRLAVGIALAMLFVYLHLEFNRTFGYLYAPIKLPLLTILWLAMCGLLLYETVVRESKVLLAFLLIFVTGLLFKLIAFDLPGWSLNDRLLYAGDYSFRDALLRLLDFGAVVGFFSAGYALLAPKKEARTAGLFFGSCALGMLFIYTTLELNSLLYTYVEGLRAGGISILWSLFALALILRGISRNVRVLRYLGLGLFAIVAWKVFFVDLARLDQFFRIIAFIVLGLLVLAGSFIYLKYKDQFTVSASEAEESA